MNLIRKIFRVLEKILSVLAIISFIALIGVVLLQILSRFTPISFIWTEEMTRYFFLYTIAFAAGLGVVRNEYIGIDFILEIFFRKNALYLLKRNIYRSNFIKLDHYLLFL